MADTFGRITGKPQMCYATFGPGLTNLSTGVCSAILDRSPMLVVSAQIPRSEICFNQTHQCIDNVAFMTPLTKFAAQIESVEEIPSVLKEALSIAIDGIPGPVYISYPLDLMKQEIDDAKAQKMLDELQPICRKGPDAADKQTLELIVNKLIQAKHPIIVAGNQVIREECQKKLLQLVESMNIPIISTLASKGVVPEDHPLFITPGNKYIDEIYQDNSLTSKIFADCDLMLLIGYDFGEDLKPSLWKNKIESIVINSFYNDMGSVYQPDIICLGDLHQSLNYICNADISPKSVTSSVKEAKQVFDIRLIDNQADVSGIALIMQSIRKVLGKEGILCSDIGLHKQYAGLLTKTYTSNTFMCSNICGSFGFGLPAGMGAKLARPDARVAVICGDGGFHSTSQDLETVVRYKIPLVIIVLNDAAFGLIKYYQLLSREEVFENSVSFGKVNFVKLANANGMQAQYIKELSMLEEVMENAYLSNTPLLIEIPINYRYKF